MFSDTSTRRTLISGKATSPCLWRRVYGFAQNGQLLDRGFLAGSLAVIAIWLAYPFGFAHAHQFSELIESNSVWAIGYAAVAVLFCCRRAAEERQASQATTVDCVSGPVLVIGI